MSLLRTKNLNPRPFSRPLFLKKTIEFIKLCRSFKTPPVASINIEITNSKIDANN